MALSDDQIPALIASIPKYTYIKLDLSNKIKLGQLTPGQKIPTEEELCKTYNCSRLTVRNALTALVNEGYITKVQGKGTFVSSALPQKPSMDGITSCTTLIKSQQMIPSKKVIFSGIKETEDHIRQKLNLYPSDPVFVYIRVYYANEIPAIYCCSFYNAKYLPGIEKVDFTKISIVEFLKNTYNIELQRSDREISASLADLNTASLLCTPKNHPLLQVTDLKTTKIQNEDVPIEYYTFLYVTDRIKYYPEVQ